MGSVVRENEYYHSLEYEEYLIGPSESPTGIVALAVARKTGQPLDALAPLDEEAVLNATDSLLQEAAGSLCIEFEYEGCLVCTDGTVVRVVSAENV